MAENVDPKTRERHLKAADGTGDVVLNLRGNKYLKPRERAVVASRPRTTARVEVDNSTDEVLDALPVWWWNPSNSGANKPLSGASEQSFYAIVGALRKMDRNIGFTSNPVRSIYQLWYHKPGFTDSAPWTNGWIMVKEFGPHQGVSEVMKIVELMDSEAVGSAKERHAKMVEDRANKKKAARAARLDRDMQAAGEVYDYTSIKNIGSGDKSVRFHG